MVQAIVKHTGVFCVDYGQLVLQMYVRFDLFTLLLLQFTSNICKAMFGSIDRSSDFPSS